MQRDGKKYFFEKLKDSKVFYMNFESELPIRNWVDKIQYVQI